MTRRGVEAMDNSYRLLDLTVYGRQEKWEDSPTGWPFGDEAGERALFDEKILPGLSAAALGAEHLRMCEPCAVAVARGLGTSRAS